MKFIVVGTWWRGAGWLQELEGLKELCGMGLSVTGMNLPVYVRAMVSVLSVGRLGSLQLSGGALAIGFTNITGYSILYGLAMGMDPVCSEAFGSKNWALIGLSLQRTILMLLSACIPISILWLNLKTIMLRLGQDPAITEVAGLYCLYALPDLLANSFLQPLRVYMRSQGITAPLMWCSFLAVVLHVLLTLLLVFIFRLGVPGVAIATWCTNLNVMLLLLAYVACTGACKRTWVGWSAACLKEWWPLLRLALPSCLGVCLEWWWYEILTLLAGYLSSPRVTVATAAIIIQTASLMYTFPMALGSSSVLRRVGNELRASCPACARNVTIVSRYRLLCYLGQGTYGVVLKALALDTGNIVAIKASSYGGVTEEEISILNYLCPNKYIVQILGYGKAKVDGCLLKQIKGNDNFYEHERLDSSEVVYIAMECMSMDLETFIDKILHGRCYSCSEPQHLVIKRLMWQLCNGLGYCHNKGVAHRDLKPDNCLLSISKNDDIQLKIADFGLAVRVKDRENGMMERSENNYVPLPYRAPELLMHQQSTYNCFAVDVWSVGCIFAEMVGGEPLFNGQCEEEQLYIIFAHLREHATVSHKFCFLAQQMGFSGMDLLGKMLELDPNKRISIQEALEHQYFSCFRPLPPPGFTPLPSNA